jgi:hypothetical protein
MFAHHIPSTTLFRSIFFTYLFLPPLNLHTSVTVTSVNSVCCRRIITNVLLIEVSSPNFSHHPILVWICRLTFVILTRGLSSCLRKLDTAEIRSAGPNNQTYICKYIYIYICIYIESECVCACACACVCVCVCVCVCGRARVPAFLSFWGSIPAHRHTHTCTLI